MGPRPSEYDRVLDFNWLARKLVGWIVYYIKPTWIPVSARRDRLDPNSILIFMNYNLLMIYNVDRSITLYDAGWDTATTKMRLNAYLPNQYLVYQHDFRWHLRVREGVDPYMTFPFENGMVIWPDRPERVYLPSKHGELRNFMIGQGQPRLEL